MSSPPPWGSASSGDQLASAGGVKLRAASWHRRRRAAVDASARVVCDHEGNGCWGTSPAMNTRRSRPSSSMPRGSGAPRKPLARRWVSSAWMVRVCGPAGRNTCGPERTTAPALAMPPESRRSDTAGEHPSRTPGCARLAAWRCARCRAPSSMPRSRSGARRV